MIFQSILSWLAALVVSIIDTTGELGIFLLMTLESANIPIPSEIIMPFAGFRVSRGLMDFWTVVLVGALGNLVGSIISYWIGLRAGRPLLERWGKYFLVRRSDLEKGDYYFRKYGVKIAFWSRMLPIVRTFVSLPAGLNRASFAPFALFTFAGSFIWSAFLAALGFWLGENWGTVRPYFEQLSAIIFGIIVLTVVIYIWNHVKNGISKSP